MNICLWRHLRGQVSILFYLKPIVTVWYCIHTMYNTWVWGSKSGSRRANSPSLPKIHLKNLFFLAPQCLGPVLLSISDFRKSLLPPGNKESYLTLLPPAFPKIIDQRTHFWFSHNTSYSIYQLVNFIFYSIVQKCYPLVVNQTIQNVLAIPNVIYYVSVFIKLDMRHLFWIMYGLTIAVIYWQKRLLLIYLEDIGNVILATRETLGVKVKV